MDSVVLFLAAYGLGRTVVDVVGVFFFMANRRKWEQKLEASNQKHEAFMERHKRMRQLLSAQRNHARAGILDGPEIQKIKIELLTLLDVEISLDPDPLYLKWRDKLIAEVAGKPGDRPS